MGTFRGQANSNYYFTYFAELVKGNFRQQGDALGARAKGGKKREVCLDPILPLGKADGPCRGLFGFSPIPLLS